MAIGTIIQFESIISQSQFSQGIYVFGPRVGITGLLSDGRSTGVQVVYSMLS